MKNQIVLWAVALMILAPAMMNAQSKEDIFKKETPTTWLGIDFSEARYLGDPGTLDGYEMKDMFYRINMLIISEPEKYNIAKAFYKAGVTPNTSVADAINGKVDESKIISSDYSDFTRLNEDKIKAMVKKYDMKDTKGLALVFIVEALNKTANQAAIWVTFVNASNKEVLLTERMLGKSGGFGFRNFWAASVLKIFEDVQSKKYKSWQKNK